MQTAAEIIHLLQLQPLPNEGGFYRQTYVSPAVLSGGRTAGTAIYFLITPEGFSALHRMKTDELWHFYAGDPVEHLTLDPAAGTACKTILGPDFTRGQIPQFLVPGERWQGARLKPGSHVCGWALLGCTMSPGWDEREFILGERAALLAAFPGFTAEIVALTR